MPRPRFHSLEPAQQQAILDAAFEEFAAHGYAEASLNRIIRHAGISKGSLYYHFDDKRDLYGEVVRVSVGRLLEGTAPPLPPATGADDFWQAVEAHALRLTARLWESPAVLALLRDALASAPDLSATTRDAASAMTPWLEQALEAGRSAGAVRADLPADLLIAVVLAMGQAMDAWLLTRAPEGTDRAAAVRQILALVRRALSP